jgi:hypothetical protein
MNAPSIFMRHVKSGGLYRVMGPATLEATGQELTIYRSMQDDRVWARPTAEFSDGRFVLAEPPAGHQEEAQPRHPDS